MGSSKNTFPTKAIFATSHNLKSVALSIGSHFLVKHLFDNEADKNNDGCDDGAYDDKFHDFLI